MKKFEKITAIIPLLESENRHGKWIVDTESKGTPEDPIQFPFVGYSAAAHRLIEAVHECVDDLRDEMNAFDYMGVLESYGLNGEKDVLAADASSCDAKCALAMVLTIIRQDRFCEGLLLSYLENGKMLEWMKRLQEIDNQ
ncbi:DUF6508 domain-containing protein [Parafannyhessea umbonata]|uniref:Uncharacterized protein n=1 Tax=Parafannyhessea umbonata TaxID=604330 RepID=A0A1H1P5L3_9ACTN|nr:DUF6508 domain-containing protein [Parafannyhessea umbonata]SDS06330.1 hypothetical protein SAMN04489857_2111 [Parafannyhessea umbonata]